MESERMHAAFFRRSAAAFFALGVALIFSGCASSGPKPTTTLENVVAEESSTQREIKAINDQLFASVSSAPQAKDHMLGEGDLIQVNIFEAPELKTDARIGARGSVSLALVGPVQVKGLTLREAEQKIEDLYRKKYLHDPHVSIFVTEQVSGKITLLGALKKPGTFNYPAKQRLFDVLAMAEGLSDKAGRMVQVRRVGDDPTHPSTFLIDLDEIIKKGQAELNLEIQSGDVIYVPEAGTVYVDGAVRKPGNYPIKQAMSIQEAVSAAGGFASTADEEDIKLVRYNEDGKRQVVQVSIKDVRKDGSKDVEVRDRDVIFVETNTMEALIYGLRLNLGSGLFGVGYQPATQ